MTFGFTAVLFILSGLLMIVLAIPMIKGKIKRNTWYGFRLPITQKSDEMWYPSNVYAGKGLVVFGLITLVSALLLPILIKTLNEDGYALLMSLILLNTSLIIFVLCYRYAIKLDIELSKQK